MKSEQAQMSGTSYKVLNQRLLLLAESWTADHHLAIKIRPGSDELLAPWRMISDTFREQRDCGTHPTSNIQHHHVTILMMINTSISVNLNLVPFLTDTFTAVIKVVHVQAQLPARRSSQMHSNKLDHFTQFCNGLMEKPAVVQTCCLQKSFKQPGWKVNKVRLSENMEPGLGENDSQYSAGSPSV